MKTERQAEAQRLREQGLSRTEAAQKMGVTMNGFKSLLDRARKWDGERLEDCAYDLDATERTPEEAWAAHADTFERTFSKTARNRWQTIKRPKGPFCLFHSTDEHLDDNATPLRLIEQDIAAAHELGAIRCHGGDALNNWPLAGRLAKKWADQECTMPDALLRLQHFISILKPDVWIDGNHEEMNPYLDHLITEYLPDGVIRDYWSVSFQIETPGGRTARVIMAHKFLKGSSWFHKCHGAIREMLEGEECDLLLDGHLHSDGVLDHTLPERGHSSLCVASAGYKILDSFAARISRGGKVPKIRGRAHWIVCDPQAEPSASLFTAFKCPKQAEAYMGGLQNLKQV